MEVKRISVEELKEMTNSEGLILRGCGGDLQEWVNGINKALTDEGILLDGSIFENVSTFEHKGCTNLLFNMDEIKMNMEKLAIWRLATHESLNGMWLSDYLPIHLGVDIDLHKPENDTVKPDCPIIGADGNIFNMIGIASRTLKKCGMKEQAAQMCERVKTSGGYHEALGVIMEYVNPVSAGEQDMNSGLELGGIE